MKSMVVLCWLLAAAGAANLQQAWDLMQEEFQAFKLQHNKSYASVAEEQTRLQNFLSSKQEVAAHNARYAHGLVGFRLSINEYSDMTHDEFVKTHNGWQRNGDTAFNDVSGATFVPPPDDVTVADEVDWRQDGAVTAVKNQGLVCASCWAFSATGCLEGQHYRRTGKLLSLSEQNLIDCSTMYSNEGCYGGTARKSFHYVKENGGINTDTDYPYAEQNNWCSYNARKPGAKAVGFANVPADEASLRLAVATLGPISAAVDGSQPSFHNYGDGVYYDPKCTSHKLDHAVLLVGYGTDQKEGDYWLIKNSWGTSWGLDGYMKLARNRENHCGVATSASYPLV